MSTMAILEVGFTQISSREEIEALGFEWKHPKTCGDPECKVSYAHTHETKISTMVTEVEDKYVILNQEI